MTGSLAVGSEQLAEVESYETMRFAKETYDDTFVHVVVFPAPCDPSLVSGHEPEKDYTLVSPRPSEHSPCP